MKLIIVSGLSGSGKSIALDTLEDCGFYCIDNLPITLLESFIEEVARAEQPIYEKTAIGIDSRNQRESFTQFTDILTHITKLGIDYEILFLQAEHETLLKRFSETRRKHPLTNGAHPLSEAINLERTLLEPIAQRAHLLIDTTRTNIHQLRELVQIRVGAKEDRTLSLFFQSFGFKHGIPQDTDFVFDARCLPNPHWEPALRGLTGKDQAVADFLAEFSQVTDYLKDIIAFLSRWIPTFEAENRTYLSIAVGCTGGQHRSVYLVEHLQHHFHTSRYTTLVRHRELS
jgi:RNase adapter protein RapZ